MSNNIFILPIGGGGEEIEKLSLNVSENGNYTAEEGTAYTEVNVNVPKTDTSVVSSVVSATPVSFTALDVVIKVASNKTITSYGVDYSTDNFQNYQSVTNSGTYFGEKTITVTGLTSGTTYQVRSFVVVDGVRYDQEPFNTIATTTVPAYPESVPAKATMMTTTDLSSSKTVTMGYGSPDMPDESFYVDWGDGSDIQLYAANTSATVSHTYSETGKKTIYCWSDSTTDTEYGKMPHLRGSYNKSWRQIESIDTPLQKIYGGSTHYTANNIVNDNMFYYAEQLKFVCSDLFENYCDSTKNLAAGAYRSMFSHCTSLTTAPELTATKLADQCYYNMFMNCTSLTNAPELPATTLGTECYTSMFKGCTSLTQAPELPSRSAPKWCYQSMFEGCTSLTQAPVVLHPTYLQQNCYSSMFKGCTSLKVAPVLPATELGSYCYTAMFRDCINLQSVTTYVTNWNWPSNAVTDWLSGAGTNATNPTVYCPADSTIPSDSVSGIPTGWTRADLPTE